MKNKFDDAVGGITGHLEIVTRDIRTGDIVDHFEDKNIYLLQGKTQILRAFVEGGDYRIKTIVIGDDFGSGSIMSPEDAKNIYTENNQSDVYEVPSETEFYVDYPEYNKVRFTAAISGINVMNQYPTIPNVVYTSATIRTFGGKAVAYRRFPPRTISELVSVDIIWTLTIN